MEFGGGVLVLTSTVTLNNNTIVQNYSTAGGDSGNGAGVIVFDGATVTGDNNIIYFNQSPSNPDVAGIAGFNYTCSGAILSGTGNITDNPLFADTTNNDFHLTAPSPCIDAGNPASPLDPDSTRADMGVFFFDQRAPDIAVSPDSLNFTDTYVDSTDTLILNISNIGDADLILYNLSLGATGVFTFDWNPNDTLLIPGADLDVTVYFAPQDTLTYTDGILIENNDENLTIPLSGTGMPLNDVRGGQRYAPDKYALYPPQPNPFNPQTRIAFSLAKPGNVSLDIYDIGGQLVTRLLQGFHQAGVYETVFDAAELPSGIYFARITAGDYNQTVKLLLIK